MSDGTIERTCAVVESLIRGAAHDRLTIADSFGVTPATADRYIRAIQRIPGVVAIKRGRRRVVRWFFADAIKAAGL